MAPMPDAAPRKRVSHKLALGAGVVLPLLVLYWLLVLGPARHKEEVRQEREAEAMVALAVAATHAYQKETGGLPATIDCLHQPKACVPTHEGPQFLDAKYALKLKSGDEAYTYQMQKGRGAAFAWIATPKKAQGQKAFCGDSTGALCEARDGRAPATKDGACVVGGGCGVAQ